MSLEAFLLIWFMLLLTAIVAAIIRALWKEAGR